MKTIPTGHEAVMAAIEAASKGNADDLPAPAMPTATTSATTIDAPPFSALRTIPDIDADASPFELVQPVTT